MSQWDDLRVYYDLYLREWLQRFSLPPLPILLALLAGAVIVFLLWKSRSNYEKLGQLEPAPEGFQPPVTVVIPARDEAANIAAVVACFPGLPVIVVDDGSSDKTAELARAAGATVIAAPPLRADHKGKPNACAAGAKLAQSGWILFVDADTRYEPGAAAALVYFAEKNHLDAVSMFLRQERLTFWERLLLPFADALYFSAVDGKRLNRTKSSDALANGQCFLVSREVYELTGGHSAVLEAVLDDIALARHLKHCRKRLRVIRGERFGRTRTYHGFHGIWNGIQKSSFRYLMIRPWMGFQVVMTSLLLLSWLPVLALLLQDERWVTAAVFAALPPVLLRKWYGGWREALLAPVAIYVFQVIALAGLYHTTFSPETVWKGREVS